MRTPVLFLTRANGSIPFARAAFAMIGLLLFVPLYGQSPESVASLYRHFQDPPPSYSMVPLVRLNDKVDRVELRWQFEEMVRQGIHGAFLLPESLKNFGWKDAGMPYEYLSPEFFAAAKIFAEEAHRAGVAVWIYDEVDWPSGSAGGRVVANPDFRGKVIEEASSTVYHGHLRIDEAVAPGKELFAVSAYRVHAGKIDAASIRDLTGSVMEGRLKWTVPEGDWQISVYALDTNHGLYSNADADLMNARGMSKFIASTHAQYQQQLQQALKIPIMGTFTDEPHISSFRSYVTNGMECRFLPWTSELVSAFERRKKYDIRKRLPLLFHDGGTETAKVRCDFWEIAGQLFVENYFGQIHNFDKKAGWISTGHLNGEEDFWWHLIFDGGNEFAVQANFDYPGLDWIFPFDYTPHYGIGWLIPFAPKFVSSAAHVYNKPRVMEETFSGEGFGASLEQMRRMVNWAYVHGVSMLVPITYKYSMRGVDRTVTYPGITYQQPYWQELRPFSDYVSRLSYLLSQGRFQGRVACLLPIPDVRANSQDREYIEGLTMKAHWLTNALMRAGYDFDFIDDASVEQASIQDGKLTIRGNAYSTILLLPMRVARLATFDKLAQLRRAGGNVLALDSLPDGSAENGEPDPAMSAVLARIFTSSSRGSAHLVYLDQTADEVVRAIERIEKPSVQLHGAEGVFSQHRKVDNHDVFFLINSTGDLRDFDVIFAASGGPELWDPESGRRWSVSFRKESGSATAIHLKLDPYGSTFVVFHSGLGKAPQENLWDEPLSSMNIEGTWRFHIEPTMSQPHIGWNFYPEPSEWKLKPQNYAAITEIRAGSWTERGLPFYSGKGVYEKTFQIGKPVAGRRYLLDLGKVGVVARVWVNGRSVGVRLWRPYRFDITGSLHAGENSLRIEVLNTLVNYFSQFESLKGKPLYGGGWQAWMLPSGLIGPVSIRSYRE